MEMVRLIVVETKEGGTITVAFALGTGLFDSRREDVGAALTCRGDFG